MKSFFSEKRHLIQLIRLLLYCAAAIVFLVVPKVSLQTGSICLWYLLFHTVCPLCGATRATSSLFHLDFGQAFSFNPVYTAVIAPIIAVFILQDIIFICFEWVTHREKESMLAFLFRLL